MGFAASEPIAQGDRWVGARARDGREIRADWVVVANAAHTRLSICDGPKRTMHTIMGPRDQLPTFALGRRAVPKRASHTLLDAVVKAKNMPAIKAATARMLAHM